MCGLLASAVVGRGAALAEEKGGAVLSPLVLVCVPLRVHALSPNSRVHRCESRDKKVIAVCWHLVGARPLLL